MVKEDIAALFCFGAYRYGFCKVVVLRQPHHEFLMVSPIAIRSICVSTSSLRCHDRNLQLCSSKFLHNIPWLGVEYPKQCLIRETGDLFPHSVDVIYGVAIR